MALNLPSGIQARAATESNLHELAVLEAVHTKHAVGSVLRTRQADHRTGCRFPKPDWGYSPL